MKTRIISILLLAAMLISLAACGEASGNNDDTSADSQNTDSTATVVNGPTLDIPDELDYTGKTIRVLTTEGILHGSNEEDQADVVSLAVYEQFLATTERLGVEFEYLDIFPFQDTDDMVMLSVNSNSDEYDLVFDVCQQQLALIQTGHYLPINDLPYIDLEKPWWNKDYIESVSINANNPYVLFGDITYNSIQRTTCVFFNKRLMEELHGLKDTDVYEMVLDGEWTLDKLAELSSSVYRDNGDTFNNLGDLHGMVTGGIGYMFEYFAFGAGLQYTTRDENGFPVINLNTEAAINVVDKIYAITKSQSFYNTNDAGTYVTKFVDGGALFLANRFYIADWDGMREMEDDFGIIPMPKYDETIDGYHGVTGNFVQWGAVPVTVADPVMVSAVAESLAYEGYNRVMPAYYETTLKLKYTRGDLDLESQMLDLITQGARTDFLYLNKLGGLGSIFSLVSQNGENSFASTYQMYETAALAKLAELIEEEEGRS